MAKHTPGPWQTVVEGHRLSVWAEGYGFIHTHESPQVNVKALEIADANARLIAAAPELLEALKVIMTEFQFAERDEVTQKVYAQAELAVAKAEGR